MLWRLLIITVVYSEFQKRFTHDNDSVLLSEIVKETIAILGTKSEVTLAYSKKEQTIVETANKEVMRHLRNFIFDNTVIKSFSRYIPLFNE